VKLQREQPKLAMEKKREGRPRGLVLSIAIHVLVILALATITFRYPIGHLIGLNKERTSALPPAPKSPDESQGAVSGKEGGSGGARAGIATGVEPAMPDPRLPLTAAPFEPIPKTPAERVDSAVKAAFGVYYDSAKYAAEHPERAPGDWTKTTADGQKWGWDPTGIRLGKFTIPNALLAALPLDMIANGRSPVDQRAAAWMRADIMEHAQRSVSEDEFRAAVRRIRERKERARRERETTVAAAPTGSDARR
jgi:hypothetical protein